MILRSGWATGRHFKNLAPQAPARCCVPTMVGRAAKKILRSRQPFLIGKWPLLGAIPLVGAQRSSQTWHAAFPSTYTFRMEAQTQRRAQTKCKSICTTKLVDSAKTAEPKMAFNFAHLLSAACGGAPHRLRRLRRPWRRAVRAPLCGFRGGLGSRKSRFVPDFDVSGKTAEPKMAFNFAHLLSAACGGAPRRLGRLRRPPGRWQQTEQCAVRLRVRPGSTQPALYGVLRGSTTTQSWLPHAREWLLYLRKHWASLVPHP